MFNPIILRIIITIMSLTLMSCGGAPGQQKSDSDQDSTKNANLKKKLSEEHIPVEVTIISKGDISNYILLSSNLETEIMADVYARIQGIVQEIKKEEGQYVKKNEVMLTLEAREYELAAQKAEIDFLQQESNFKRLAKMYEENLLSNEEFERAKFTRDASEVQKNEALLNLDYMQIRSTISGRVGERLAKIGTRIQPTDKLFSVVDNSHVIAVVYVPEKNLNQLKIGQKALVYSDHIQGKAFDAWIKRISPVVDPASGTFKVTVGVRNTRKMLRPGMFVNAHIILDTHENVVLVPKTAIVYENEYMNVFIVRDSLAHKIRLTPGYEDNTKIESLKDIEAGDQIVVIGQAGMKDKSKVNVVTVRDNPLAVKKDSTETKL